MQEYIKKENNFIKDESPLQKISKTKNQSIDSHRNHSFMEDVFQDLSNFSLGRSVQLKAKKKEGTQPVVQRLGGVARQLQKFMNNSGLNEQYQLSTDKNTLFIPKNGGSIHIHAWSDGCKISHCAGISGYLITGNQKNDTTIQSAIDEINRLLSLAQPAQPEQPATASKGKKKPKSQTTKKGVQPAKSANPLAEYGGAQRLTLILNVLEHIRDSEDF